LQNILSIEWPPARKAGWQPLVSTKIVMNSDPENEKKKKTFCTPYFAPKLYQNGFYAAFVP
jgi:hypothetical protein